MERTEVRFFGHEIRAEGRALEGVVMPYRSVATLPWGKERFESRALYWGDDVTLNVQHDRGRLIARTGGGGLTLSHSDDSVQMRADLPPSVTEADNTLAMVRAGLLRGLSVEFRAEQERRVDGVRVIQRARLVGVGVVDRPAYDEATVAAMRARSEGAATVARVFSRRRRWL